MHKVYYYDDVYIRMDWCWAEVTHTHTRVELTDRQTETSHAVCCVQSHTDWKPHNHFPDSVNWMVQFSIRINKLLRSTEENGTSSSPSIHPISPSHTHTLSLSVLSMGLPCHWKMSTRCSWRRCSSHSTRPSHWDSTRHSWPTLLSSS